MKIQGRAKVSEILVILEKLVESERENGMEFPGDMEHHLGNALALKFALGIVYHNCCSDQSVTMDLDFDFLGV